MRSEWMYITCSYFNPRSHEGSDYDLEYDTVRYANFNPRSHEGSDRHPKVLLML